MLAGDSVLTQQNVRRCNLLSNTIYVKFTLSNFILLNSSSSLPSNYLHPPPSTIFVPSLSYLHPLLQLSPSSPLTIFIPSPLLSSSLSSTVFIFSPKCLQPFTQLPSFPPLGYLHPFSKLSLSPSKTFFIHYLNYLHPLPQLSSSYSATIFISSNYLHLLPNYSTVHSPSSSTIFTLIP